MTRHESREDGRCAVWYTADILNTTDAERFRICHGFSTRHGGISTIPYLAELNFGFQLGEERAVTCENYRLFAETLGIDGSRIVTAKQTHTSTVLTVDESHCGLGLTKDALPLDGYDALVTDTPEVALSVRVADCVPILFADTKNGVIGAAHAGWRGTFGEIAAHTVSAMCARGAEREFIRAAIGASVGVCCYEVDDAFYERFSEKFGGEICRLVFRRSLLPDSEKYHADLKELNRLILLNAGLPARNVEVSALCTCCQPELFHSHRAAQRLTDGKRGLMCAMIAMKRT